VDDERLIPPPDDAEKTPFEFIITLPLVLDTDTPVLP